MEGGWGVCVCVCVCGGGGGGGVQRETEILMEQSEFKQKAEGILTEELLIKVRRFDNDLILKDEHNVHILLHNEKKRIRVMRNRYAKKFNVPEGRQGT